MINELHIVPLVEVNGVKFGTSRQQVREKFGEYNEFKKTPFSSNTTDDFGSFHVFYDKDNKFEAVEVFDNTKVIVDDVTVFPGSLEALLKEIEGFVKDEGYYTNYALSIGVSLSDNEIESILFGCKGYYGDSSKN